MITAWRLALDNEFAESALSGEGAKTFGGRWNPPGVAVVYSSGSLALAALELFVHLGPEGQDLAFIYHTIGIPKTTIYTPPRQDLPQDWRSQPIPVVTKAFGQQWVEKNSFAVLSVPSIIVPDESNFVLNPRHKDFSRLKIAGPKPFYFDPRMWNKM